MNERCNCCGQLLPLKGLPEGVKVTPTKRWIWEAVTRWPGMSAQDVMGFVFGHRPDGGPEDIKNIHVHISQFNRQLRQFGIEIRGGKYDGYRVRTI